MAKFDIPSIIDYIVSVKDEESGKNGIHEPTKQFIGETSGNIGYVISPEEHNRQARSVYSLIEDFNSYFKETFDRLIGLFSGTISEITEKIQEAEKSWKNRQNISENAIVVIGQYHV
jgi:hypothetical protein